METSPLLKFFLKTEIFSTEILMKYLIMAILLFFVLLRVISDQILSRVFLFILYSFVNFTVGFMLQIVRKKSQKQQVASFSHLTRTRQTTQVGPVMVNGLQLYSTFQN